MEALRYIVLVNGLLAVVSLAYYVLLRRETFFGANRLALWLGVTSAFILPLLELPDWRPQPVRTVMQRTAQVIVPRVLPNAATPKPDITITYPNGKTFPAFQQPQQANKWPWQYMLIGLYALGVLFLSSRFLIQYLSLRKLIRRSLHEPYDGFTLVCNETIASPFSFFNWVVLNPDRHTSDELEQILRHERVHVRERHSLDMIGAEWLCILFWFNPAVYLFRHLIHQTLEFSADRAVLAEGVDAKLYQYNLLKVSLAEGKASLTNHFSKSQLTSRIVMLNKPDSSKATWLKYPVLVLATLTIATLFARPKTQTLARFMPRPAADVVTTVLGTEPTRTPLDAQPVRLKAVTVSALPLSESVAQVATFADTIQQPTASTDSVRVSSSRYVQCVGNMLYWVITPKTSIDDFVLINQELSKYGRKMQLNEVRYDPTYSYIDRITCTIVGPTGYGVQYNGVSSGNGKPISSFVGFVGIGAKANIGGTHNLPNRDNTFPADLRKVASDEERAAKELYKEQLPEKLVRAGKERFALYENNSSVYTKADILQAGSQFSELVVLPNGSLSVSDKLENVFIYINNLPVQREAVGMWNISQLYKVIVRRQVNPQSQQPTTTGLFIYAVED